MRLTRAKYAGALVAAALGATVFAAAPASAASDSWKRDCSDDTTYEAKVDKHKATTTKRNDGDCQGLAYVRIKVDGDWLSWSDGSSGTATKRSPVYEIQESQHKDCNCATANYVNLKP
ncbi:hypothetical protein GCM10010277_86240 [Streptomyces longisporoflavus]|uniref:hypothetical protein n=1 Tax=Streptomyces longisporoflavus TaxID=28044 RepID=UPI00167C8700|nr:hypothetical protein [Streptomyces longisporoflavus]GGV72839.1 hypothetical protein GCM10010277_86240 [Streptomyces longisporoflavus]